MPDILDLHAQANPDKVAVIQGDDSWTYAEHNARANAFARGIQGLGIDARRPRRVDRAEPREDRPLGTRRAEGAARLRPAVATASRRTRWRTSSRTPTRRSSSAIPTTARRSRRSTRRTSGRSSTTRGPRSSSRPTRPSRSTSSRATDSTGASMIYTSGTTGKPEGRRAQRQRPGPRRGSLVAEIRYTPDDVHITTGPLYHSGPAAFSGLTHALGGTVVDPAEVRPGGVAPPRGRAQGQHDVHRADAAQADRERSRRTSAKQYDVSILRSVIANAAPVPFALKKQWIETFGEGHLFEVYGSTELGVDTIIKPEDQLRKPGSCGQPYGGIEIRLIREDGTEAPHRGAGRDVDQVARRLRRVLQGAGEDRGDEARRRPGMAHGRRHRLPRRRGVLLHLRPPERHDHLAAG